MNEAKDMNDVMAENLLLREQLALANAKLNDAINMLAPWVAAISVNGGSWDYWDDHYKEAFYNYNGCLREELTNAINEQINLASSS
jgi:hypothetical protein